jgi:hypothetical protein
MLHGRFVGRIADLRARYAGAPALPFSPLLAPARISALFDELGTFYRDRIFSPCVTLWVFLSQALSQDHSCRDAVARLLAFRAAQGLPECSASTGSYCQARKRLPEELLSRLARQTAHELHEQALDAWRFHGRRVKLVDGTTLSMPDTKANARAFGKPKNQTERVGFPVSRVVVLICLATGAILELAIGSYVGKQSGERSLFRSMQDTLKAGDIVLGDRLFGTFCDIARLVGRGVDGVFGLHGHRAADFRRGRRLGPDDHLITWRKPARRPDWLGPEEFAEMSAELTLRQLRVRVNVPGFRTESLVVMTTLIDPLQFSHDDIAELYRHRWHAELDLRSIKTVMQMDVLRCKTPEMIRKEIWAHVLAYNLLRTVMCEAATKQHCPPRELSFKGTLQLLNSFYQLIVIATPTQLEALCARMLMAVGQHRVANRPNRYEPRKRKRAAKPYPPMKQPRAAERKLCLKKSLD